MDRVTVKIVNRSGHSLPTYETPQAAGMDVHACLEAPVTLMPMERALIPTGLRIALPEAMNARCVPAAAWLSKAA